MKTRPIKITCVGRGQLSLDCKITNGNGGATPLSIHCSGHSANRLLKARWSVGGTHWKGEPSVLALRHNHCELFKRPGCLSGTSAAAGFPPRCRLQDQGHIRHHAHIRLSGCHGTGDSSGKATVWFRAQPSCSMLAVDVGCCFCIGCMGADRATNHCP